MRAVSEDRWRIARRARAPRRLLRSTESRTTAAARSVDYAAQELDAERVPPVALERRVGLGLERHVSSGRLELARERLIVQHQTQPVAWPVGMGDQIELEERDSRAELPRANGRGPADPVADVVDRVVALGRVDDHGADTFGQEGI